MTADTSKQTPKLRFPEFRDAGEWEYRTLKELSVQILEKVGETKLTPVSITAGYGFVSQEEKFGRNISGVQYKNYIFLRRGDFAYNRGNSKKYPQGYVCQLKEFDQAAASTAFICFQLKDGHKAGYFQALFDKNLHGIQLSRYITSGARSDGLLNISAEKFFSINLPIPKQFEEQAKIADCLDSIDELIGAESQKLEALKTYKKGMMQQLFPAEGETVPKLRFPEFCDAPEWEEVEAVTLFNNRIEKGEEGLPIYSVTINDGMVKRSSLDRKIDDVAEPSGNKKVYKGDIAYNMMRIWQGAFGLAIEDCMVSPAYIVLAPQKHVWPEFYNYVMKLPKYMQRLADHSQGITLDRLRLYYKDFGHVLLPCPPIREQQKIAELLNSIDEHIDVQSQQLDALKQHKQGLMQQLFPSSNDVQAVEEDGMEIVEE